RATPRDCPGATGRYRSHPTGNGSAAAGHELARPYAQALAQPGRSDSFDDFQAWNARLKLVPTGQAIDQVELPQVLHPLQVLETDIGNQRLAEVQFFKLGQLLQRGQTAVAYLGEGKVEF